MRFLHLTLVSIGGSRAFWKGGTLQFGLLVGDLALSSTIFFWDCDLFNLPLNTQILPYVRLIFTSPAYLKDSALQCRQDVLFYLIPSVFFGFGVLRHRVNMLLRVISIFFYSVFLMLMMFS